MADAVQTFRAISWLIVKWLLLILVGIVALCAVGIGLYYGHAWYTYDRHAALVEPVIRLDSELCKTGGYPLFIAFSNKSTKTIDRVSFTIGAKVPERSSELAEYKSVSSDTIIKPGAGIGHCYSLPKLSEAVMPSKLNWSLRYVSYTFSE
jgi:hypothetical protein